MPKLYSDMYKRIKASDREKSKTEKLNVEFSQCISFKLNKYYPWFFTKS